MFAVRLDIDAVAFAVGLTFGTGHFALSVGANLAGSTVVLALATVFTIGLGVDALAVANLLTSEAGNDALSTLANFAVFAGFVAGSAVCTIGLEVVTSAFASGLAGGAVQVTLAVATDFALLTLRTTSAAVFAIVVGVHADIVAVGLSFGTGCLDTFTLVTVMLTGAVLDLGAPLEAAASIFDTSFVLTGCDIGLGCAIPAVFFALGVRAVGNTLVLFALLEVFADGPTFTLAPYATFAFLGSFHTGFAICGQTALGGAWSTLHTLVVDAGGVVFVGAVFVFQTFDTTASSVAFLTRGAIFVGTTNAFVVLGALLGGAGVRLTMCIFQTRHTFSSGG